MLAHGDVEWALVALSELIYASQFPFFPVMFVISKLNEISCSSTSQTPIHISLQHRRNTIWYIEARGVGLHIDGRNMSLPIFCDFTFGIKSYSIIPVPGQRIHFHDGQQCCCFQKGIERNKKRDANSCFYVPAQGSTQESTLCALSATFLCECLINVFLNFETALGLVTIKLFFLPLSNCFFIPAPLRDMPRLFPREALYGVLS